MFRYSWYSRVRSSAPTNAQSFMHSLPSAQGPYTNATCRRANFRAWRTRRRPGSNFLGASFLRAQPGSRATCCSTRWVSPRVPSSCLYGYGFGYGSGSGLGQGFGLGLGFGFGVGLYSPSIVVRLGLCQNFPIRCGIQHTMAQEGQTLNMYLLGLGHG
jgi:hypothetical protein